MISFIKANKHFAIGLLASLIIVTSMHLLKWILIDPQEVVSNTLGFLFLWSMLTLIIYKLPDLTKNKSKTLTFFGLLVFLFGILTFDNASGIKGNPITVLLLVVFGGASLSVFARNLLLRFRFPLIIFYSFALGYFLYLRVFSEQTEVYDQQQKEIAILLIAPYFIIVYLWVYQQWKNYHELKIQKSKAELELLKNQINPHFLFNTLNNLYGLTVEQSEEAPAVVLKLSEMLRYTIYDTQAEFVALHDEIKYLENYIGLQSIRYQKTVSIRFNYPQDKSIKIAPLLFIILVENAFKHGVEKIAEETYVHIDLTVTHQQVIFTIQNKFDSASSHAPVGIGLENLRQRLHLIYPNKHTLTIQKREANYKTTLKIPVL